MYRLTLSLIIILLGMTGPLVAQDSLLLHCPLREKLEPPASKNAQSIGAADLQAVWISRTDTAVRAVAGGMINLVLHDEDGKWELFLVHDDLTFWYSGLARLNVVKGQPVKAGELIAQCRKGDRIILRMMDAETSVDPKPWLNCGD